MQVVPSEAEAHTHPIFLLHIRPEATKSADSQLISHAGHRYGLQIYLNSMSTVTTVGWGRRHIGRPHSHGAFARVGRWMAGGDGIRPLA